jgi:hypothetical protein
MAYNRREILIGTVAASALLASSLRAQTTKTEVFDAKALSQWPRTGNANWTLAGDVIQATSGSGYLVSAKSYGDFKLRAEVWVDTPANSGIFIRCQDANKPATTTGYEVNIYDTRKDPSYGTGAIVEVAKVDPMPKAGGKWNVLEISAQGPIFNVIFNGEKTVTNGRDEKFARGHIALQYGAGDVRFRRVEITEL